MRNRSLFPRPWWQVGLTVLPGVLLLLNQVSSPPPPWDVRSYFLWLAVMVLLSISSVSVSAVRRSPFKVPAWGSVPLGLFAGMGLISTICPFRFYLMYLVLVVTGLLFARHNGLSASLFVLVGGIMVADWVVEPVMYFWDSAFWRIFINFGVTVLFTILTPILVLRSRSILGQVVGLLFPLVVYSAAFVFALSSVRGFPIGQSAFTAGPFIALTITIAVAATAYEWISRWDFTAGEAEGQSAI